MEDSREGSGREGAKGGRIIRIEEEQLSRHLDQVVRGTVEETLNALLEAEADRLCQARRYERTEGRQDTRAGHYTRKLHTKAGEVEVRMPKLRTLPFETALMLAAARLRHVASTKWGTRRYLNMDRLRERTVETA